MTVGSHPALREAALLGAVGAALLLDAAFGAGDHGITPLGLLAAAVTVAVLAARHRAPLAAVPAMCLAIAGCLATLDAGNTVVLPGAIAAYAAAAHGDRRRSPALIAILVPAVVLLVLGFSEGEMHVDKLISNIGIAVAAVLLGDGVRARRATRLADEARHEQEVREREQAARAGVAEERLQIARDVHDVVAHSIVAINVQAGVAAHLLHTRPEHAEAALVEIKRVSGAALADLRTTLGVLRSDDDPEGTPLRPTDPLGRLEELADPLRAAGVAVDVRLDGDPEAVPTAVGTAVFRIVQEALTNVLRHAGAASAVVRVVVTPDDVTVEVTDDGGDAGSPAAGGSAATTATAGAGAGLRGVRERAAAVGGSAQAGRDATGGWRVRAHLPLAGTGAVA
ncbi:unannotated protein [freshwater metagenome]|uniref:histidine kinase n=1 Tax=freshwater metagenome TaxID=449393 RepID=A0A6J7GZP4_9ZZZZ|nr:sensor histidine kinase [Actinomycetota bacterium]